MGTTHLSHGNRSLYDVLQTAIATSYNHLVLAANKNRRRSECCVLFVFVNSSFRFNSKALDAVQESEIATEKDVGEKPTTTTTTLVDSLSN
jgi:hypothetical protein